MIYSAGFMVRRPGVSRLDPAGAEATRWFLDTGWAVSSAEEHFLDMEGVRGSIPVPPTSLRSRSERSCRAVASRRRASPCELQLS